MIEFIIGLFIGVVFGIVIAAIVGINRDPVEMFTEDLTGKVNYPNRQQDKD